MKFNEDLTLQEAFVVTQMRAMRWGKLTLTFGDAKLVNVKTEVSTQVTAEMLSRDYLTREGVPV